ncbi:BBE domain-containing protein [Pseudonocardia sp. DSM 110487]|nr:BBE domain-containing protein [Pseudonocardia sp. DSM 110487]
MHGRRPAPAGSTEVKTAYDPENVFHRNHNIPPHR